MRCLPLGQGDHYTTEGGDTAEIVAIFPRLGAALVQLDDGRVITVALDPVCDCGCLPPDPDVEDGCHEWPRGMGAPS